MPGIDQGPESLAAFSLQLAHTYARIKGADRAAVNFSVGPGRNCRIRDGRGTCVSGPARLE